jgi:hypothetical protein
MSNQRSILVFLLMTVFCGLQAQFQGGDGDGFAAASLQLNWLGTQFNQIPDYQDTTVSVSLDPWIPSPEGMLQVYPNPVRSNGQLHLVSSHQEPIYLEIYNMQGKRCAQQTWLSGHPFDLNSFKLPAGSYLLHLRFQQNWISRKIMVLPE